MQNNYVHGINWGRCRQVAFSDADISMPIGTERDYVLEKRGGQSLNGLFFRKKPWVHENRIEIREILNLTILFDHDGVDGSPAARFTDRLVKNIEGAVEL